MCRGRASRGWRAAWGGVLAGLAGGSVACAYRFALAQGTRFARASYQAIGARPWLALAWVCGAALLAWAVRGLLRAEPSAAGSGIPQVKGYLQGVVALHGWSVLGVRFVGGVGGSLAGLSLGREGPCVHLGAAAASLLARPLRADERERHQLATAGAAAGLSAAFSAPVSGMLFAIEGLHHRFSPLLVISSASGAIAADAVASGAFGERPVLDFGAVHPLPLALLWVVVPLGALAGAVGAGTNRVLLRAQRLYGLVPPAARLPLALATALPVGLLAPDALGGGEGLIGRAQLGALTLAACLALGTLKLAFTATSFGSGMPGGIFMPILALGTLTGAAYARVALGAGLPAGTLGILAVCGMGGVLAASVKAPLTSILLVAEMSGSFGHLLAVATTVMVAMLVSDALGARPIYDALLERSLGRE